MHIAFYGAVRHIGTSANMSVAAAGLAHYLQLPVSCEFFKTDARLTGTISLTDCSRSFDAGQVIESCDLLVINLSRSYQELEHVYFRHSLVRKNVIFLFGKYVPHKSNELKQLAKQYRIAQTRVCMIPYNPRFGKAYEDHRIFDYLKSHHCAEASYEDLEFEKNLKHVTNTILTYGNKKGDYYYG